MSFGRCRPRGLRCGRWFGSGRCRWCERLQTSLTSLTFRPGQRPQELVDHGPAGPDTVLGQQICYGFAGGDFVSRDENVIAPSDEVLKASPAARLKLFDRSVDGVRVRGGHKPGRR